MRKKSNHINRLDEINKKQGFEAPKGYFDNLQNDVFDIIDSHKEEQPSQKSGKTISIKFIFAIAASIAIIMVSVYSVYFLNQNTTQTQLGYDKLLEQVSDDEIIAYLDESEVSYLDILEMYEGDFSQNETLKQQEFEIGEEEANALLEYYSL